MKYLLLLMIGGWIASCSDNSPARTNVEDSSTINTIKENSTSSSDSVPGISNGVSTVSGSTGAGTPGSGVSTPAKIDSSLNPVDSNKRKK